MKRIPTILALCAFVVASVLAGCDAGTGVAPGDADNDAAAAKATTPFDGRRTLGQAFRAGLTPLNATNGIAAVSGYATFRLSGGRLTAQVKAENAFPGIAHAQHIHTADECPPPAADVNGDGFIDVIEGVPFYGPILVPLDGDLGAQGAGADGFPVASATGALDYFGVTSLDGLLADLQADDPDPADAVVKLAVGEGLNLGGRHVVVHGVDPDMELPETVASLGGLPAQATLPVACGEITDLNRGGIGVIDLENQPRTFRVEIENVGSGFPVLKSGAVLSPGGPDAGPAIFPGETATFSFTAPPNTLPGSGMRLNFVTMFVQSNDLFYAFSPEGLALYDADGHAVTGDVTGQLVLYDAGTEVDQEPGVGDTQKPAQDPEASNVGPDEDETVQPVDDAPTNGFAYPDAADVIQVVIEHDGETSFTVNVTNVSTATTLQSSEGSKPVPLSPIVYAVHTDGYQLFEVGEPASEGLELVAEDGFPGGTVDGMDLPGVLADELAAVTGVTVPLSPGAFAVHSPGFRLFEAGEPAGEGLEDIAEDGVPTVTAAALAAEDAVSMSGTFGPPPIGPGGGYTFTVNARPGDRLSLATMFVQSNDLFYAVNGLPLFQRGVPIRGDVTKAVALYDAGTEVDEEPGVGLTQVIRQSAPDTGMDEGGVIVRIGDGGTNDGFSYRPNAQIIRVTVTPTSF